MFCHQLSYLPFNLHSAGRFVYYELSELNAGSKAALSKSVESISLKVKAHEELDWKKVEEQATTDLNKIIATKEAEFDAGTRFLDSQISSLEADKSKGEKSVSRKIEDLKEQKGILLKAKDALKDIRREVMAGLTTAFDAAAEERRKNGEAYANDILGRLEALKKNRTLADKNRDLPVKVDEEVWEEIALLNFPAHDPTSESPAPKPVGPWNSDQSEAFVKNLLIGLYVSQGKEAAEKAASDLLKATEGTSVADEINEKAIYGLTPDKDPANNDKPAVGTIEHSLKEAKLFTVGDKPEWVGYAVGLMAGARKFVEGNPEGPKLLAEYAEYLRREAPRYRDADPEYKREIDTFQQWAARYGKMNVLEHKNIDELRTGLINNIVQNVPGHHQDRLTNILTGALAGISDPAVMKTTLQKVLDSMGVKDITDPQQLTQINVGMVYDNPMNALPQYSAGANDKKAVERQDEDFGKVASGYMNGMVARMWADPGLKDKKVNGKDVPQAYREYVEACLKKPENRAELAEMRSKYRLAKAELIEAKRDAKDSGRPWTPKEAEKKYNDLQNSFEKEVLAFIQKNIPNPQQYLDQLQPAAKDTAQNQPPEKSKKSPAARPKKSAGSGEKKGVKAPTDNPKNGGSKNTPKQQTGPKTAPKINPKINPKTNPKTGPARNPYDPSNIDSRTGDASSKPSSQPKNPKEQVDKSQENPGEVLTKYFARLWGGPSSPTEAYVQGQIESWQRSHPGVSPEGAQFTVKSKKFTVKDGKAKEQA